MRRFLVLPYMRCHCNKSWRALLYCQYSRLFNRYAFLNFCRNWRVLTMGVRIQFSRAEQSRHFAYPCQVADHAMQMDIYPFYTTKRMSYAASTVAKMLFIGSNASFLLILHFKQYKTAWLAAINNHTSRWITCHGCLPSTVTRGQRWK